MKYKIFDTGKGVIVSRQAQSVQNDLEIFFSEIVDGAHVIFETKTATLVREIDQGACSIPVDKMRGEVSVRIKERLTNGSMRTLDCESFLVSELQDGSVLVCPNDMDLPTKVAELFCENQELRNETRELRNALAALSGRLQEMAEGWDIV